jgi:anhydro-N-acetylmuramic acid kinase
METQSTYKVIGLMSGTSGDGLDIAYCEFENGHPWTYQVKASETIPFPKKLGKKLMKSHQLKGHKLSLLDVQFGQWMGEEVSIFIQKHQLEVEAVASHGHTVFHQPSKKLSIQIGNGWALHVACGIPVINDFRMLDVQLGGQGAPLVPIGDKMLFPDFDYCINLGGIANISMESEGKRIAFDICPFNLLLNHFAEACGKPYDKDGKLARKGKLLKKELKQLNQLPYYQIHGAKSLGREDLKGYLKILDGNEEHKPENILHTLVIHYVEQINKILIPVLGNKTKVLVTGGGTFNTFFIEKLVETIATDIEVVQADPLLINYKEALVFAFLAVLKIRGESNSLASVTGASRDNCGGVVYGY